MTKALVTLATGSHRALLDVTRPQMQEFADRHGYDLIEPTLESERPPSWWKVPALRSVLEAGYDEALWVDADVAIIDPTEDLNVPADAWQALVLHHTGDGTVPNCGVWLVRQPMTQVLYDVWTMTHRVGHGWFEQSAVMDLLGFTVDRRPSFLATKTKLYDQTHWLGPEWNYHLWDTPAPERVRFAHATMFPDRLEILREWAAGPVSEPAPTACRHRYPIQGCVCEAFFKDLVPA